MEPVSIYCVYEVRIVRSAKITTNTDVLSSRRRTRYWILKASAVSTDACSSSSSSSSAFNLIHNRSYLLFNHLRARRKACESGASESVVHIMFRENIPYTQTKKKKTRNCETEDCMSFAFSFSCCRFSSTFHFTLLYKIACIGVFVCVCLTVYRHIHIHTYVWGN